MVKRLLSLGWPTRRPPACWAGCRDASSRRPFAYAALHHSLGRANSPRHAGCSAAGDETELVTIVTSGQGMSQLCLE